MQRSKKVQNGQQHRYLLESRLLEGINQSALVLTHRVESLYGGLNRLQDRFEGARHRVKVRAESLWNQTSSFFDKPQRRAMVWSFVGGMVVGAWMMRPRD